METVFRLHIWISDESSWIQLIKHRQKRIRLRQTSKRNFLDSTFEQLLNQSSNQIMGDNMVLFQLLTRACWSMEPYNSVKLFFLKTTTRCIIWVTQRFSDLKGQKTDAVLRQTTIQWAPNVICVSSNSWTLLGRPAERHRPVFSLLRGVSYLSSSILHCCHSGVRTC